MRKMRKIKYLYYVTPEEYPNAPKRQENIVISEYELKKYSILNGQFNGQVLTKKEKDFYTSFYNMALKKRDNTYVCTSAYENAESSYKNVISFAMGMLATRIVALKKYGIVHLFHLKDKSIEYTPKNKRIPDWFGLIDPDDKDTAFLFESKGTFAKDIGKNGVTHAKDQLNSISKIIDKSKNNIECTNFQRHAIVSCFTENNSGNIWTIQDVDPEGEEDGTATINLDRECFKYYKAFIDFLDSYEEMYYKKEIVKISNQKYYFLEDGNDKFGICKSIYDAVKSEKYTEENEFNFFYKDTIRILNEIEGKEYIENSSSYEDGIIVCSSEVALGVD